MGIRGKIAVAIGLGLATIAAATPAYAANSDWFAPAPALRKQICADPLMQGYFQKWITGPANSGDTFQYTGFNERPGQFDPANMKLFAYYKSKQYFPVLNCLAD